MGEVYRAHDPKLNRDVALKILSTEWADADARRRFQREAQTASALNHPHIVSVYDAGEDEGRQYLVTEYIDGGTLRQWARSEPRTWRQVVELLIGVADGLAVAHQAGILHRDIKPENILIMKSGYAKLADFGLATLDAGVPVSEAPTLTHNPTAPGVVVGTLAYMSPEQASGKPLDARADVFSFGLTLFELLAGQRPFSGMSDLELLQKIIHAPGEVDRQTSRRRFVPWWRKRWRRTPRTATSPCGKWSWTCAGWSGRRRRSSPKRHLPYPRRLPQRPPARSRNGRLGWWRRASPPRR